MYYTKSGLRGLLQDCLAQARTPEDGMRAFREQCLKEDSRNARFMEELLRELSQYKAVSPAPPVLPEEPVFIPETLLDNNEVETSSVHETLDTWEPQPVQETYITHKQSETKCETSPTEQTLDTLADKVLAEIPEPTALSQAPKKSISISETKKAEMLRSVTEAQWKAGVCRDSILLGIQKRADQLEWQGNVRWLVETTITRLASEAEKDETVNDVPPVPRDDRPAVPMNPTDDEEWVSTWDLPTSERLDRIADFLSAHRGEWFTRAQIEIGAGYRRPDDHLPKEDYEKLKRRVQRDLALLEKDGDVIHTTRPNPKKNTKGQNNDMHLYRLADPDQDDAPDPDAFPAGLRRDLGAAIAAFDQRDMDALIEHLTPVSNWLARVAGVTQDTSS
jgi:hypothetical protein